MLKFEYEPYQGRALTDGYVEKWILLQYEKAALGRSRIIPFGTDNVIYCGRMLLAQEKIPYLCFLYEGKPVEHDVLKWPAGFGGRCLEWEVAWLRAQGKLKPETPELGCNRHLNCHEAEFSYRAQSEGRRPIPSNFHCHDDDCEDCFGQ